MATEQHVAQQSESNTVCAKVSQFNRKKNASKMVLLNVELSYIDFFLNDTSGGNESRFCNKLGHCL